MHDEVDVQSQGSKLSKGSVVVGSGILGSLREARYTFMAESFRLNTIQSLITCVAALPQ